jgi:pimeloyl-ACP methyl ester carboxylesterase
MTTPHDPRAQTLRDADDASLGGWAEVRARDTVVRYRCHGAGRLVVLVAGLDDAREGTTPLVAALAEGARVLQLASPATRRPFADWLSDVLDGLGMHDVTLLVSAALRADALELGMRDGQRVGRLVIIDAFDAPPRDVESTPRNERSGAPIPMLVVAGAAGSAFAAAHILRFIRETQSADDRR